MAGANEENVERALEAWYCEWRIDRSWLQSGNLTREISPSYPETIQASAVHMANIIVLDEDTGPLRSLGTGSMCAIAQATGRC